MPAAASAPQVRPVTPALSTQPVTIKPIKVSEMPNHPSHLKEAKHYKKLMEWYSKVEDADGKKRFFS